jgi:23S rRNA (uracil1939-C5)-methyltransferase
VQLKIEKLIYGGEGLAHLPADENGRGKSVFVPFVLPGEEVEAVIVEQKKSFARAGLQKIIEAAPERIAPECPYFQRCGGCHYQHMPYEYQLEAKAAILKENLRRLAKLELPVELQIHASPAWNYRNRTRLKVQAAPQFALGYHKMNSHELLPVEQCPISSPLINRAISALWSLGTSGKLVPGILEIELFANAEDSELLIELYSAPGTARSVLRQISEELKSAMAEISGVVAFKSEKPPADPKAIVAVGSPELTYRVGKYSYRVSAGAFFQINRHLAERLLEIVTQNAQGNLALDLYAGVGLFSTALAGNFAQVVAVEPSHTSFADLTYNSPRNVKPVRAMTDQFLRAASSGPQPDLVVVDPPRAGLGDKVVRELTRLQAPRLTYVSCDPATLSRDLSGLLQAGYRIEQAHLVDLFPQTYHLESVFLLSR